jgi:hypothetical protein
MWRLDWVCRIKKISIFVIFNILVYTSCIKEEINLDNISSIKFSWGVVVPIAQGELNMKDIIESNDTLGSVSFYPDDSLLYLYYEDTIISETAENLVSISDQSISESFSGSDMGVSVSGSGFAVNFSKETEFTFNFSNGEKIDSIAIKSGTLNINLTTVIQKNGTAIITVPNLTKNGSALQLSIPISTVTNPYSYSKNIDITGYYLKFNQSSGSSTNKIEIDYNINLGSSGNISSSNSIDFDLKLENIRFSKLFGYIGKQELINKSGNIEMSVFKVNDQAHIQFYDPKIEIFTGNSIGASFEASLSNFKTYSDLNNVYTNLIFANSVYTISSAPAMDVFAHDTVSFSRNNCNIADAIATTPSNLYYNVKLTSNPNGEAYNFLSDQSKFDAFIHVELPMYLRAEKYEIMDTMDFDIFSKFNDISVLKSLTIHDSIENWLPIDVECMLILVDTSYQAIDTIFTKDNQPVIKSGTLNSKGKISTPSRYSDKETFTSDEILPLKDVKYALFKVAINSTDYNNNTYVKFYLTDKIKIYLGLQAQIKVTDFDQLQL